MFSLSLLAATLLCSAVLSPVIWCEQYSLTSNVGVTEGHQCPEGVVTLTCVGRNLTGDSISWYVNGDQISQYTFTTDQPYPREVESTSPGVAITVWVVSVMRGEIEFVNSTLRTRLPALQPYSVGCGSVTSSNTIIVTSSCRERASVISVEPAVQTCVVDGSTSFQCQPSLSTSHNLTWAVNDTAVTNGFPGFTVRKGTGDGRSQLLVTGCQAAWSGTHIRCVMWAADQRFSSGDAVLKVELGGAAVQSFISANWVYVVVIAVIGVAVGFIICCVCSLLCWCCCLSGKTKASGTAQDGTQDLSFRSRSVGGRLSPDSSSNGAKKKKNSDLTDPLLLTDDTPSAQRNRDRMRQEEEERRGFLNAMRDLPDKYPSSTFREQPPMGSRLQKYWGTVLDRDTEEDMIITRAPVPRSCRLSVESDSKLLKELLKLLYQCPLLHGVQDILPHNTKVHNENGELVKEFVVIVSPPAKQSLRDLIHRNKEVYKDWADKYPEIGTPLETERVRLYSKQMLDGIIFLYDFGFPVLGHIQTGNIYVDANMCQLGGYENTLLGYKSRLHDRIAREGHLESIDVIMFGHVIYEMCTGRELSALAPSEQEYTLVGDEACVNFLQYIFKTREGGTFKRSIKKIRSHDFLKLAHTSDVKPLLETVAGKTGEERSAGGRIYGKLTSLTSKVLRGGSASGEYQVKPKGGNEMKEMAKDDDEATLLTHAQLPSN